MSLKNLSDEMILENTRNLAREERELLTKILHHLREIERRRLFSKLKRTSLFDYAVKDLGYSEDQAARRIAAMRLLKELPELEEKVNSGALSLTHLGMAQTLFRREAKENSLGGSATKKSFSREEKLGLLGQLENTSKREAEKIVIANSTSPSAALSEKIRAVAENLSEVRFTASDGLLKKLEWVRGLRAHARPQLSLAELIDELCNLGLEKWDPARPRRPRANPSPAPARVTLRKAPTRVLQKYSNSQSREARAISPRSISASTRREVWQTAKSSCKNCGSQFALEVDHMIPYAKGGCASTENLRLLCRSCNQRAAIEHLGLRKMESYLE